MFDIQHDSPVPFHEQITSQLRAHIASGALVPGASLPEFRAFAQTLLTNPQVVARAYRELQDDGVLLPADEGRMQVSTQGPVICKLALRQAASERLRQAVAFSHASGLNESDILTQVQQALVACNAAPLTDEQLLEALKKQPTHGHRHRPSESIQDLSRKDRPGFA